MKNKIISAIKAIALQSSMICFGILFVTGIIMATTKNYGTEEKISYLFPISVVVCSVLCGCAILVFSIQKIPFILQCVLHFLLIVGIVTGCNYLFNWTASFFELLIVYGILIVVYAVIWLVTYKDAKKNAEAINKALESTRDEE